VRSRTLEYGRLADELHIIVFAKRALGFREESFPPNIFLYPTNARTRWGYVPRAILWALKLRRRGVHIDVVTAQDPFETGFAAFFIARILHAKLHLQIHTDFMSPYFAKESFANRIRVMIAKFLIPHANAIRVVSLRIKASLSSVSGQLSSVSVLPIFVDRVAASRDQKHYPQFDHVLLVAARLAPEKNIALTFEAMRSVVESYPKTGLVIVGEGPEEARLKKLAVQLGFEKNVVFEGWQEDLSQYYQVADALVVSSLYEGYGMVAVEALGAGCPVVMTDVGCAGEVVRHGENGLVVPVGDREALARAIKRIVSGGVKLEAKPPTLPTKEEYLAAYRASWEDALRQ